MYKAHCKVTNGYLLLTEQLLY